MSAVQRRSPINNGSSSDDDAALRPDSSDSPSLQRLGSLLTEFGRVMSDEKAKLSDARQRLCEDVQQFEDEKARMADLHKIQASVLELNVGGVHYTVSKSTLCQFGGSLLEAMFSGRHALTTDAKGRYFIDRNGRRFEWILDFLREPLQFVPPADADERQRLRIEAEYFGLEALSGLLGQPRTPAGKDKPTQSAQQAAAAASAPGVNGAYCDAACTQGHPNKACRVCGTGWGPHVGHQCPGTNNRGSFPL